MPLQTPSMLTFVLSFGKKPNFLMIFLYYYILKMQKTYTKSRAKIENLKIGLYLYRILYFKLKVFGLLFYQFDANRIQNECKITLMGVLLEKYQPQLLFWSWKFIFMFISTLLYYLQIGIHN